MLFSKTTIPWNKGKKETRPDVIQKMRDSHIGKMKGGNSTSFKAGGAGYWLGKKRPEFSKTWKRNIRLGHTGEKNYIWKGDDVGYSALHHWITRTLGRPDKCESCEKSGFRSRKIHWANKSHKYKRDLNDWIRLCVPCHSKYDNNYKKLCLT